MKLEQYLKAKGYTNVTIEELTDEQLAEIIRTPYYNEVRRHSDMVLGKMKNVNGMIVCREDN